MQFSFTALTLLANTILAANNVYMTVTGQKQGVISGGSQVKTHPNAFTLLSADFAMASPYDPSTGMATGKRIHSAVQVSAATTPAYAQLLNAANTNELLTSVVLVYTGASVTGAEVSIQTITLKNVNVVGITQEFTAGALTDNLSLIYQSIQVATSAATATDTWNALV